MTFFFHNLIHTVVYARPSASGVNAAGDPTSIANQVTIPARVEARRDLVRAADGREVVTTHRIYTRDEVKMGDRIWVPHLGDSVSDVGQSRHPLTIQSSERLRAGGDRLYTIFL